MAPAQCNSPIPRRSLRFRNSFGLLLVSLGLFLSSPRAESAGLCSALFQSHETAEYRLVQNLIRTGVVTPALAKQLMSESSEGRIAWDLLENGKISEKDYDLLSDAYYPIVTGHPLEPGKRVATLKAAGGSTARSQVLFQKYHTGLGDETWVLHDLTTDKALGVLHLTFVRNEMRVDLIRVAKDERRQHYSELLLREALKVHPEVVNITGQLAGVNVATLQEKGLHHVPLYRTLVHLGFSPALRRDVWDRTNWIHAKRSIVKDGKNTLTIVDKDQTIAGLSFHLVKYESVFLISSVFAQNPSDERKLTELLLGRAVERFAGIRLISGSIAKTNQKILLEKIRTGLTPLAAFQLTPLGSALTTLGFTKQNVHFDDADLEYVFEARRP